MVVRLDRITISDFKRIKRLELVLKPVTAIVGGNTSGKSSALQAAQLGVSVLQAAFRKSPNGGGYLVKTVANDDVLFRPTQNLLELRHLTECTQNLGYSVRYGCTDLENDAALSTTVEVKRGKNANIAMTITGDDKLTAVLADPGQPFSILTPGLSGIPLREEWRTRGSMDAAVMHGDANMYLRTVLDHLFAQNLDLASREAWKTSRDIAALPDSDWKTFCSLLDRCYLGARIIVKHDQSRQRYISVEVEYGEAWTTLDMASTGMLQVIQILAYTCFYGPPLLLLDEPDAHLHADSQSRLYEALRGIAEEKQTRILLASHSPQLIQRLMYDDQAEVIWMRDGARVEVDAARRPAIPILMTLGALTSGAEAFDPNRNIVILAEDKTTDPVLKVAQASGVQNRVACLSYNGCGNLSGARLLARIIADMRQDVRIFIHRDRDFRTEAEVEFEKRVFATFCRAEGIKNVVELFTSGNDVEHLFARPAHLKAVFTELESDVIDQIIVAQTALLRDRLVHAIRVAREKVKEEIYEAPRLRGKAEWAEAGMPDQLPQLQSFLPADGLQPVSFEMCHGKTLLSALRAALH